LATTGGERGHVGEKDFGRPICGGRWCFCWSGVCTGRVSLSSSHWTSGVVVECRLAEERWPMVAASSPKGRFVRVLRVGVQWSGRWVAGVKPVAVWWGLLEGARVAAFVSRT